VPAPADVACADRPELFGLPVPDQLSAAASIGFLSLSDGPAPHRAVPARIVAERRRALKAQITQQRSANGLLTSDLPKTVINAPLCNRVRLHTVGVMTRVCVVGSVNMDMGFGVETLPHPGETVLAASFRSTPGGKGANQAVAAARAGAQVQFVGAVGDDSAADALRAHLTANDVGTDGLITVPGPSGRAVVVVDSTGENLIIVAAGANGGLALDSALRRELVADCDVLLLQLEIPVPTATVAAREAHSAGATVIVNASPSGGDPDELAELARLTDVVVVNEAEAAHWVWPVPHRVITRGARGASYAGGGGELTVAAPAVAVVDTSGAGDVFAGVLAAGWANGHDHALRRACAAGALATLVPGAGDCAPYDEAIEDATMPD
jgi:ribokinase